MWLIWFLSFVPCKLPMHVLGWKIVFSLKNEGNARNMEKKNSVSFLLCFHAKYPYGKKTTSRTQVKRTLPGCKCKHKKSKNYDHTLAQWDTQGQQLPKKDTVSSRTSHQICCKTPWNRSSDREIVCVSSIWYSIWSGPGIMCGRVMIIGDLCVFWTGFVLRLFLTKFIARESEKFL